MAKRIEDTSAWDNPKKFPRVNFKNPVYCAEPQARLSTVLSTSWHQNSYRSFSPTFPEYDHGHTTQLRPR